MKIRGMFWWLQAIPFSLAASLAPAEPALVYDNGPVLGPVSYNMGVYIVSDSFTVSAPVMLNSAQVYLNVLSVGTPTTVQWRIGTTSGGAEISSGFASLDSTYLGGSVHECAFELSGNLAGAGTYYLTLTGVRTSAGGADVYWWESDGPSTAYVFDYGPVPSESFRLYGEIVCKDQVLCNDSGQCGATVSFGPLATTNWPGYVVTIDPPLGSFLPVGTNTVTWNAVGAVSGQLSNTCNFLVTVRDCEPPQTQSPDMTVTNDPGQCSARVNNYAATATDNCPGGVVYGFDPPPGSIFPAGRTTVNFTAIDATGNTNSCSFAVTVQDGEPPVVSCQPLHKPYGKRNARPDEHSRHEEDLDGLYQLLGHDICDPNPRLYIQDSASGFLAGPFANGDIVKITKKHGRQDSNDARNSNPARLPIVAHLRLQGNGLLYGVDASGNVGASVLCRVPSGHDH